MIPATIGPAPILVAPIGFMMTDGTAGTCTKETMPKEMTGNTANYRSLYASGRIRRAGRQTDNSQHRGCRNEHRLHNYLLLDHASAGPILAWR